MLDIRNIFRPSEQKVTASDLVLDVEGEKVMKNIQLDFALNKLLPMLYDGSNLTLSIFLHPFRQMILFLQTKKCVVHTVSQLTIWRDYRLKSIFFSS